MIAKTVFQKNNGKEDVYTSQSQFIIDANRRGVILASMPDIYHAIKVGDEGLLSCLRDDSSIRLITSTRIKFKTKSPSKVIHYYTSENVSPHEISVAINESGRNFKKIEKSENNLGFLQALFNTNDGFEEMNRTLSGLSDVDVGKILIRTPFDYSDADRGTCIFKERGNWKLDCDLSVSGVREYDGYSFQYYNSKLYKGHARELIGEPAGLETKLNAKILKKLLHKGLDFNLTSEIDQQNNCVYFTNTQQIGNFTKHSGMFCFKGERYVVLITTKQKLDEVEKTLSEIFASQKSSKEKVEELGNLFSPVYLHLERYTEGKEEYKQVDDLEIFGGI